MNVVLDTKTHTHKRMRRAAPMCFNTFLFLNYSHREYDFDNNTERISRKKNEIETAVQTFAFPVIILRIIEQF